jgi:hypothetical protein
MDLIASILSRKIKTRARQGQTNELLYINHQCVQEGFGYLPMNDEIYHVSGWSGLPRLATDC